MNWSLNLDEEEGRGLCWKAVSDGRKEEEKEREQNGKGREDEEVELEVDKEKEEGVKG